MNKIYRVVRNASTGNWVVVSELTHGRGKGKGGRASKPALLALAMAMASPAMATSVD
ncbi:MAG: ESPR domain-containing protein [Stenotrophomonas sp.]|uniref:ESPR domain-containing protein n=1 Tax=Stenotrophomonas sp. TaxID=69392 RepID=UPI003D6D8FCE